MTRQQFVEAMFEKGYTVTIDSHSSPAIFTVVESNNPEEGISWNVMGSNAPQDLDNFTDNEFRFYLGMSQMESGKIVVK
jgi:hypothetical protein